MFTPPKSFSAQRSSQRNLRVAALIKRILADHIYKGDLIVSAEESILTLPCPITITNVWVSSDLHHATVAIMPLGGEQQEAAVRFLNLAAPSLRSYLAKQLKTRFTPDLKFIIDNSFTAGERIDKLLRATLEL